MGVMNLSEKDISFLDFLLMQIIMIESVILTIYLLNYVTISIYNLNALHQFAVNNCIVENVAANEMVCLV